MKAILIIGFFKFPFGSASAERMRAYAVAFRDAGVTVRIATRARIGISGDEWREMERDIQYRSVSQLRENEVAGVLKRLINQIRGMFRLRDAIREYQEEFPDGGVLVYERRIAALLPIVRLLESLKVNYAFEVVEWYHHSNFKGGRFNPLWWDEVIGRRYCGLVGRGVICITTFIRDKFSAMGKRTLVVPAVVDPNEHARVAFNSNSGRSATMVYLGSFKEEDAFEFAVNEVGKLIREGFDCRFILVGNYTKSGIAKVLKRRIGDNPELRGRVEFSGFVSNQVKVGILASADLILMPRHDLQVARAAFPTRMAELLLTGIPLVTSNVGDVSDYLTNDIEALLYAPSNTAEFSSIIKEYLTTSDHNRYISIGENGRLAALNYFTPNRYIADIIRLISGRE